MLIMWFPGWWDLGVFLLHDFLCCLSMYGKKSVVVFITKTKELCKWHQVLKDEKYLIVFILFMHGLISKGTWVYVCMERYRSISCYSFIPMYIWGGGKWGESECERMGKIRWSHGWVESIKHIPWALVHKLEVSQIFILHFLTAEKRGKYNLQSDSQHCKIKTKWFSRET